MIDRVKNWFRAWRSSRRDVWVDGHFRSLPARKPQKAREGIKPLILEATEEFLMPTEVGRVMATIADKRVAMALQELRSKQEAEGEASRLQMEEINRRLTEVDDAVKELRAATVAGADQIEELNHRLATHAASSADAVEGINTRLAGLQEEIAKETADRHGAISHLHAALTEKISATHVEQMFQKLRAESAAKDRDALLIEEVNDRRLREVEAVAADIRVEVAQDAERLGELRHDVDAQREATDGSVREIGHQIAELKRERDRGLAVHDRTISELRDELQVLRERLGRNREVRIPALTMRVEEGDDGVMTLEPVVPQVSQAVASD